MDEQPINLLKPQQLPLTPEPKKRSRLVLFFFLAALVLGVIFLKTYIAAKWPSAGNSVTLQPKKIGLIDSVKNYFFPSDHVMTGQENDRINILLLGIGGAGHDGPYLSDTNIILSIKPSTKEVAMISVPRDLAVKIGNYGYRKINNANAFGELEQPGNGAEYARKIFAENFNIDIPYYARVDFEAFKEIIDDMGGVTINVEKSFTDNSYPGPNDSYQTISFQAGTQEMNGERALTFSRSRHGNNGEGSDFARAKRQQLMISAVKEKLLSSQTFLNPITIQKILSSLSKHIVTNISFEQIMFLAGLSRDIDNNTIKNLVLTDAPNGFLRPTTGEGGAYLLVPKTGNFSEIQMAINTIFDATSTPVAFSYTTSQPQTAATTPSVSIPKARIEVQNGTWRAGLAALKRQDLEKDGLFISNVLNSTKRPIANTTIYIVNKDTPSSVITTITKSIPGTISSTLPDWLAATYNETSPSTTATSTTKTKPDVIVILGEDTL